MSQGEFELYPDQTAKDFIKPSPSGMIEEEFDIDGDELAIAQGYELEKPEIGDNMEEEEGGGEEKPPLQVQGDEFACSVCCLVKHKSQFAGSSKEGPVCKECAESDPGMLLE